MNRLAVITGGTGGLGKTVTAAFLKANYDVIITYRVDDELRDLLESIEDRSRLDAVRVDVTDEASLDELAQRVHKRQQPIDALICLVGGFAMGTLGDEAAATFDKMMLLNTKSFLLTCNALVPLMKPTKKEKKPVMRQIIGIAAKPALEPTKNIGIYAASKAAVASLVRTLAKELLTDHITVNALAPSTIDTPANRKAMPKANPADWVTAEQLAETLLFLCSEGGSTISGTIVPVYGRS